MSIFLVIREIGFGLHKQKGGSEKNFFFLHFHQFLYAVLRNENRARATLSDFTFCKPRFVCMPHSV